MSLPSKKRKKHRVNIEPILLFLIGLGLGETIRRLALWLHKLTWLDALFIATKLGIIGYVFWLGLKQWAEIVDIEETRAKYNGQGCIITSYKMLPIFYWLLGATMAMIMFHS